MANKVQISSNAFLYPMPVVLVGSVLEGRTNYMTVAWVSRVNYDPPLVGVAIAKRHRTAQGIAAHGEFGVSVPGQDLLVPTDHVGLVSGNAVDKSRVFQSFTGSLAHAPMARECPLTMACRVTRTVELPSNTFFIGEIVEAYCEEACLTDRVPDVRKIAPIGLTMPDNRYWSVGEFLGQAWSVGKGYQR
jgi:flavin reductase (DIM6/NTAB) family NADH-FMN oxidoreductase RutF